MLILLVIQIAGFLDQEKDAAPVWWLEGSSYPIEVLDKKKVKVLVRSEELKRRYKHDPVIISFEWGKGVVYHMISHFYLQRSETRTQKQGNNSSGSFCLTSSSSSFHALKFDFPSQMNFSYTIIQITHSFLLKPSLVPMSSLLAFM